MTEDEPIVNGIFVAQWFIRGLLLMFAILLCNTSHRKTRLPPGPPRWPFIGNLNLLASNPTQPYKVITDLGRQFGPIMTFQFGRQTAVIINDFETLNEAFVQKANVLSERPDIILRWEKQRGGEVAVRLQRDHWHEVHKENQSILHKVGVRRGPFEHRFGADLELLVDELTKYTGVSFDPAPILTACVTSLSWNLCSGQRLTYDDPDLVSLISLVFNNLNDMRTSMLQDYVYLPVWLQNIFVRHVMKPTFDKFDAMSAELIKEHQMDWEDSQINDVISAMLALQRKRADSLLYSRLNLQKSLSGFMLGGVDSMQSVLRWLFLYFIHYPHVQDNCYTDIQKHIADNHLPCVKDSIKLTYITATIYEILRHANIAPLGVPHTNTVDAEVCGYVIPRDTLIFSNQYAIHRDPKLWDRPDEFLPERWLSNEGALIQHRGFMPFSIGPRHCPGEKLAKIQLVLLTAGLLQRFKIVSSTKMATPDLEGIQNLSLGPKPFQVELEIR